MFCTNCGREMPDGTAFCTNCGTALASAAAADVQGIGASLEAAVQANQDAIDSIEARAQAQVDEAFQDFPPVAEGAPDTPDVPDAPAAYGAGQPADQYQQPAAGQTQAVPVPVPVAAPVYQQDAYTSPNAHYSSQRSYDANAYGQDTGQAQYRQPSYGQPGGQAQQEWNPQPATSRALAMVLYVGGLIGMIVGLCVRDKSDPFITHHLNNVVVIFIGCIIGTMLSIILIGGLLLLYLLVMTIMGMVSAYNGDMKELPLIGKIHIIS